MVSIFANMIMKKMEVQKDFIFDMKNVKEFREEFDKMFSKMKTEKGIATEEIQIGNIPAEFYSNSEDSNSRVMLYLHGGGYFGGSIISYRRFVSILCKKLHLNAYCINYRLAPEDPYPAGLDDAFFAYKWMLEEKSIPAERIIIMGDSAGGGMTLALLHRIGKQNLPQPKAAICLSPWTDLTCEVGQTYKTKEEEDVFFNKKNMETSIQAYLQTESPKNPEVSPIFSDFNRFPPIFLQVGTREMLLDDSLIIAEKMKKQGVSVKTDVWQGMFHAFLIFTAIPVLGKLTPEFRRALKNVQMFIESL